MKKDRLVSFLMIVFFSSTMTPTPLAMTVTSDYSEPIYWGQTVIIQFTIADSITRPGFFFRPIDIINVYVTCSFGRFEYKGAELHIAGGLTQFSLDVPMEITVPWWTEEREYLTVLHFTYFLPQTGRTIDYSFNGPIIQVKGYLIHITGGTVVLIAIVASLIYRERKKRRSYLFRRQNRR